MIHQFQPLLYQVATAGLDASNISFPLRKAFHNSKNVRIRVEELKEVIASQNKIITINEEISYDALILALGTETNFFGNQNLRRHFSQCLTKACKQPQNKQGKQ